MTVTPPCQSADKWNVLVPSFFEGLPAHEGHTRHVEGERTYDL